MKHLEAQLINIANNMDSVVWKPELFNLKSKSDEQMIKDLISKGKVDIVVDDFNQEKSELHSVKNPVLLKDGNIPEIITKYDEGLWVYYAWRKALVHILNEQEFPMVRISRNQILITKEEQEAFQNIRIGIAGLNVGNPGALCITLEGGSHNMKLADNDILSLSNMNRFRANLYDLGMNKAILTARQIYETNPYVNLEVFPEGITDKNIYNFLLNPKLDLLIEETDNLLLKVKLRKLAKGKKIPVLMVTGNGSNVIIDVERFDLDDNLDLLSGHLKEDVVKELDSKQSNDFNRKIKLARDFMGSEILTKRLNQSFDLVGIELAGIPQLAETSYLRGAVLAWFTRNIVQEKDAIKSGRYFLELEKFSSLTNK